MAAIQNNSPIHFYSHYSQWKEFSNFYPSPIEFDGRIYPTGEHLFQAFKYLHRGHADTDAYAEEIRLARTPGEAKELGNKRRIFGRPNLHIRPNWDIERDNYMRITVSYKFANPALKAVLLSTGDREIVEHTVNDIYWGDGGGPGRGQNKLGLTLMYVRSAIRQFESAIDQE
jgi:N-glycosidase YbiA